MIDDLGTVVIGLRTNRTTPYTVIGTVNYGTAFLFKLKVLGRYTTISVNQSPLNGDENGF